MHAKHNRDTVPRVINGRINGRFAPGCSGCPGGSPEATRRAFNKRFLLDLAEDWQQHGREVFKRVRRESPASYLKVCAMLVPREMRVEYNQGVKAMSDEQLEAAVEILRGMIDQKLTGRIPRYSRVSRRPWRYRLHHVSRGASAEPRLRPPCSPTSRARANRLAQPDGQPPCAIASPCHSRGVLSALVFALRDGFNGNIG
jgi:hypothetical protein